jgi:hypothetical protein
MLSIAQIPVWSLVAINVIAAVGFWVLAARLFRSRRAEIRTAVGLVVAYAAVAGRAVADFGSARVILVLTAEALVTLAVAVLPFVDYVRFEIAAQRSGKVIDKGVSNKMGTRILVAILALLAVFFAVDGLLIRGFFAHHA